MNDVNIIVRYSGTLGTHLPTWVRTVVLMGVFEEGVHSHFDYVHIH